MLTTPSLFEGEPRDCAWAQVAATSGSSRQGRWRRTILGACLAAFALIPSGTVSADLISIDINSSPAMNVGPATSPVKSGDETGGFVGQVGPWNSLYVGPTLANNTGSFTTGPLNASTAGATSIVFTLSAPSPVVTFNSTTIGSTGSDLRDDILHMGVGYSGSLGWTITGLVPGALYDLKFFGQYNPPGTNWPAMFTVAGGGPGIATSDVATFTGITATGGTISGSVAPYLSSPNGGGGSFSGLQIQGTFVPEPSSFVLAGLGLVGLAGWGIRRRRKG